MNETRAHYEREHKMLPGDPWFVLDIAIPVAAGVNGTEVARMNALMVEQGVKRRGLGYPTGPGVLSASWREVSIDTPAPGMVISHYLWKLPRGTRFSLRPEEKEGG